jgi:hypothetical protein
MLPLSLNPPCDGENVCAADELLLIVSLPPQPIDTLEDENLYGVVGVVGLSCMLRVAVLPFAGHAALAVLVGWGCADVRAGLGVAVGVAAAAGFVGDAALDTVGWPAVALGDVGPAVVGVAVSGTDVGGWSMAPPELPPQAAVAAMSAIVSTDERVVMRMCPPGA